MQKLKCTVSYDGTFFSGFQIQPNKRTVQQEIENAIMQIHNGEKIRIYSSGRTDTGVHARGQVFHFETNLTIPESNWKKAFNAILPNDIYMKQVERVPMSFHARFDATQKEYRYFVLNSKEPDVFKRNLTHHDPWENDIDAILVACEAFKGTHDFTSFCSARTTVKGSKVRTLSEVSCKREGNELQFILKGDGFLYNMARIIVGVLLEADRKSTRLNSSHVAIS